MAKTSLNPKEFKQIQTELSKNLTTFKGLHAAGEQNDVRISRANTLNRMSKIVDKVAEMGDPQLIIDTERQCERFYLASFAQTDQKKQSSMKALQAMQDVKRALAAPMNPEQYKADMRENLGDENMGQPLIPKDTAHLFVKSQMQRLSQAPGQMATRQEELFFRTRKEALKTMLKLHERNCAKALGLDSGKNRGDIER